LQKILSLILAACCVFLAAGSSEADDPVRIDAPALAKMDFSRTDGGLPPVPNLKTFVLLKADKEHPELSDGRGWTYHHHPDLACWKGRLYVAWSSNERDEDTGISRELYRTSADGEHWSDLAELFPTGVSTPLRMYFFHAPNGRMLAIAGLRTDPQTTDEKKKGPLVVRQIKADHTLGDVFTLQKPEQAIANQPPMFDTSKDHDFVEACWQLLADHLFLEQQDYGVLLAPVNRIKWQDPAAWGDDEKLRKNAMEFGRAMCFVRRGTSDMVAVGKKSWMSVSHDNGQTWEQPIKSQTLITGMGKVWAQRLADDRYIIVYDPHESLRFPLVLLTSKDGLTFTGPARVVHGELPALRYPGKNKKPGSSYVRGLSLWSDDGSRGQDALWLIYSVNKEEIWISRVPLTSLAAE
jgi:hypothetical protein